MKRIIRQTAVAALAVAMWVPAAEGQIVVVSSSVQERNAAPGESYMGQIRLRNDGSTAGEVRVYQTDYLFYADGRSLYTEPGSHGRSNAAWLTVSPTSLVLGPGESADIGYRVSVPAGVGEAGGTYWSMIMVEPVTPPPADPTAGGRPQVGLQTVVRFGVQVATHVGTGATHRLDLGNPKVVVTPDGGRSLEFELVNSGDAGYRPHVSLEMFSSDGEAVVTMESQRGLLFPGTSTLQRFELKQLPAGTYEAFVVVDTGSADVFGAQFTITVSGER